VANPRQSRNLTFNLSLPAATTALVIAFMLIVVASQPAQAQTLTTLISFNGPDGVNPYAGLVLGSDGYLYGTTYQGGASGNYQGTVFKISPQSPYTLTTLHTFLGSPTDGAFPYAGLVQGTDGFFYGTTVNGGASSNCTHGCGTVFKISADGSQYSVLHSFTNADGSIPEGTLIQAADGNFYGTTFYGGTGNNCADFHPSGCGTVFKISPQSPYTLTTVHSFNFSDGYTPEAGLVQATNGNFYGTTSQGVTEGHTCGYGCGTVFEMIPQSPYTVTTLHVFQGSDGFFPGAPLIQGGDSNFYGTTARGGANNNCVEGDCGTVFKISPQSPYTLTTVSLSAATGSLPTAPLLQATDLNFYGTTNFNAANNGGSVFKLTEALTLTPVYSFCAQLNCADGESPSGLLEFNGLLYGTTFSGGAFGAGTVFSLDVGLGLGPAVSLSPTNLNFGPQGIDIPNTPQTVTLTNSGGAPLVITSIAITGADGGDYFESNNCPISPNTLAPGSHCSIEVVFSPTASGTRNADVTITDNAPGSPQMVPLTGIGVGGKVGLK
jgi:uncharacterized repeat protein (TIGR03803 family)